MKSIIVFSVLALCFTSCGDDDGYGAPIDITKCNGEVTPLSDRVEVATLEISDWSVEIRAYVASELAGYGIANVVCYKNSDSNKFFLVELDDEELLLFDDQSNFICAEGDFSTKEEDDEYISIEDLPQNIIDYITTNYPGIGIHKAEFEDNEYEVELDNDIELCFDAEGNFLKEC